MSSSPLRPGSSMSSSSTSGRCAVTASITSSPRATRATTRRSSSSSSRLARAEPIMVWSSAIITVIGPDAAGPLMLALLPCSRPVAAAREPGAGAHARRLARLADGGPVGGDLDRRLVAHGLDEQAAAACVRVAGPARAAVAHHPGEHPLDLGAQGHVGAADLELHPGVAQG